MKISAARPAILIVFALAIAGWIVKDNVQQPEESPESFLSDKVTLRPRAEQARNNKMTSYSHPAFEPADAARMDESPTSPPVDLFKPHSWMPPPPPPVIAVQAPVVIEKPVAPPLPYRLMGRFNNMQGENIYYLINGSNMIAAQVGQTIDGTYRVESVNTTEIVLIYLPLNEKQIISIPMGTQ